MPDNTLDEGTPRIGWMIDGDEDTPHVAVMLQITEDQIVLTVPTSDMFSSDDPYAGWFAEGLFIGEDGQLTQRSDPPRVIKFYDHRGVVTLVGCRIAGFNSNMAAGAGRIVANFAVMGDHSLTLEQINGMRTEMPALAAWTRMKSTVQSKLKDEAGRVQELTITLRSPSPIRLLRTKNFTLYPSWRTTAPEPGTLSTHEVVQLTSLLRATDDWGEHLRLHRAMQDLLSISAWRAFGYSQVEIGERRDAVLNDDPRWAQEPEVQWSKVVSRRLRSHEPWSSNPRFLFMYQDIGAKGIRRWFEIRRRFERALLPLINVVDQQGMFMETRVLQTGIALEALGYQLAADATPSALNSRGQIAYSDALQRILDDMPFVPIKDVAGWKDKSRRSYMGVKHADNGMPDMLTVANAYRENALVLRYWLAAKLGCSRELLRHQLQTDPLRNEFLAG